MVFLTNQSVADRSVALRCEGAMQKNLRILPAGIGDDEPTMNLDRWIIPRKLSRYQCLWLRHTFDDKALQFLLKICVDIVPKLCFISYSRSDERFVKKLEDQLQIHGIKTWRDTKNIPGGASWDSEIEKAMRRCHFVLFVTSKASIASQNVADEIGFAREIEKTIIPILIEDVNLPFRVHRAQMIDFSTDFENSLQTLLSALNAKRNSHETLTTQTAKRGFWTRILRWNTESKR